MPYENETDVVAHHHTCENCGKVFVCASEPQESTSGALIHYGYLNRKEICDLADTEARRNRAKYCNTCLMTRIFR